VESIGTLVGPSTKAVRSASGLSFYDDTDIKITVLNSSKIYLTSDRTSQLLQNTAAWTSVTVDYRRQLVTAPAPSAFLVIYHILMRQNGSALLTTSDGRRELRVFIAERLLPRLRSRTDDWEEDDEDTDLNRESISHAFTYLHKIYISGLVTHRDVYGHRAALK
jgi:hypothetical protein